MNSGLMQEQHTFLATEPWLQPKEESLKEKLA